MPKTKKKRSVSPSVISKAVFAKEIAQILSDRELTQLEAGRLTGEAPSQLSLIVNGKLRGMSPERLIRSLTALGRDVEIRITESSGKTGKVRVTAK